MLMAVATSQIISRYGIDEVLKPLVEEMMDLEFVRLITVLILNVYAMLYYAA